MSSHENIDNSEVVFEEINKKMKYGAPELKKFYQKYVTRGLIIAVVLHGFLIGGYVLAMYYEKVKAEQDLEGQERIVNLSDLDVPPPIDEVPPEPPKDIALKDLSALTPEPVAKKEVTEEVKKSGLRGRGGAGFPTGMKWSFLAKPPGIARYLVCNADESEPGTFKDRYLMERIPHLLIEGMITSSYALGANTSYIYIRGEYYYVARILEKAIDEAYANGWLGKNILGSEYSLDLYVQIGAGAYICGEETALLESLEGKRGNPRIKPPFPAVAGLYGCPTVVNNVETIAAVVPIVNDGGDEYAKIGIGKSTGTKLISASGHINKPGVYEIDLGVPVEEFIFSDKYCGGIRGGKKLNKIQFRW